MNKKILFLILPFILFIILPACKTYNRVKIGQETSASTIEPGVSGKSEEIQTEIVYNTVNILKELPFSGTVLGSSPDGEKIIYLGPGFLVYYDVNSGNELNTPEINTNRLGTSMTVWDTVGSFFVLGDLGRTPYPLLNFVSNPPYFFQPTISEVAALEIIQKPSDKSFSYSYSLSADEKSIIYSLGIIDNEDIGASKNSIHSVDINTRTDSIIYETDVPWIEECLELSQDQYLIRRYFYNDNEQLILFDKNTGSELIMDDAVFAENVALDIRGWSGDRKTVLVNKYNNIGNNDDPKIQICQSLILKFEDDIRDYSITAITYEPCATTAVLSPDGNYIATTEGSKDSWAIWLYNLPTFTKSKLIEEYLIGFILGGKEGVFWCGNDRLLLSRHGKSNCWTLYQLTADENINGADIWLADDTNDSSSVNNAMDRPEVISFSAAPNPPNGGAFMCNIRTTTALLRRQQAGQGVADENLITEAEVLNANNGSDYMGWGTVSENIQQDLGITLGDGPYIGNIAVEDRVDEIISLLQDNPEGLLCYFHNEDTNSSHSILFVDYIDGQFYAIDYHNSPYEIVPLTQTWLYRNMINAQSLEGCMKYLNRIYYSYN